MGVLYLNLIMSYCVQYWNEGAAEWRGTGTNHIPDITTARARMRALAEQCGHCVSFRVEQQLPDYVV